MAGYLRSIEVEETSTILLETLVRILLGLIYACEALKGYLDANTTSEWMVDGIYANISDVFIYRTMVTCTIRQNILRSSTKVVRVSQRAQCRCLTAHG